MVKDRGRTEVAEEKQAAIRERDACVTARVSRAPSGAEIVTRDRWKYLVEVLERWLASVAELVCSSPKPALLGRRADAVCHTGRPVATICTSSTAL